MKGLFVTGTGTGVGKTFVTAALARRFRAHGAKVFAFKPIETGCVGEGEDQKILCEAAGGWQTGALRGPYRFADPLAPAVAAGSEVIDLDRVFDLVHQGASQSDIVLVEGAGGWRVPLTEKTDISDLAARLGLPVLVVGLATLGTINHSLLTVEVVERSCRVAGLVLSCRPGEDGRSNAEWISKRWAGRVTSCRTDEDLDVFRERFT